MKKIALITGLLIAFLLCGVASAEIDLTTGNEVQTIDVGHSTPMALNGVVAGTLSGENNCDILWDITHGVMGQYAPGYGSYTTLESVLNNQGCIITTTSAGVNNVALSDYDVLVVNVASSINSAYTPVEVNAITNFVNSGKGLLIMGDNPAVVPDHINPVSQVFGTTTGIAYSSTTITNFGIHPITNGISHVSFAGGGKLTTTSPSTTVGWDIIGNDEINIVNGKKVVIIGDINVFTNNEAGQIGLNDNQKFAENIFNYLCTPTQQPISTPEFPSAFLPATLLIGFLGAVLLIQRTREQ